MRFLMSNTSEFGDYAASIRRPTITKAISVPNASPEVGRLPSAGTLREVRSLLEWIGDSNGLLRASGARRTSRLRFPHSWLRRVSVLGTRERVGRS